MTSRCKATKRSKAVVVSCFFPTPAQLKVELAKPAVQQSLNDEMFRQQSVLAKFRRTAMYLDGCE